MTRAPAWGLRRWGPFKVLLAHHREHEAHHYQLRRICAFDLVTNNADRKSGHCLLAPDGTIYCIDNGLCFHVEPKLRTRDLKGPADTVACGKAVADALA